MIERIFDEQQSAASVTFKNYGQTPARHATVWLETRICDLPLVDTDFALEGAKKRTPKCTIGPSGEIAKNAKMPKLPAVLSKLFSGKNRPSRCSVGLTMWTPLTNRAGQISG